MCGGVQGSYVRLYVFRYYGALGLVLVCALLFYVFSFVGLCSGVVVVASVVFWESVVLRWCFYYLLFSLPELFISRSCVFGILFFFHVFLLIRLALRFMSCFLSFLSCFVGSEFLVSRDLFCVYFSLREGFFRYR